MTMAMTRKNIGWRRSTVVVVGIFLCAVATYSAPPASAETCTFELSPPQLVTLTGGVVQVTASLTPRACEGTAMPQTTTVCLATADSAGRCQTAYAWTSSRVFVDRTERSGAADYHSYGKGCLDSGNPARMTCRAYGPLQSMQ
jgi:hypothetical protein